MILEFGHIANGQRTFYGLSEEDATTIYTKCEHATFFGVRIKGCVKKEATYLSADS